MKTYNLRLLAATTLVICCAIILTACSDNASVSKDVYTLTIEQAKKRASLVTLSTLQDENIDNSPLTHWTKGEKVEVLIDNGSETINRTSVGTLVAQEDGESVTLTGTVSLKGYNIDKLFSSNNGISLLLVTSPAIEFNTKQDGTLSTIMDNYANVLGSVYITGVNKETKELMHGTTDVFGNLGALMKYILRDANGLPINVSHLIISCIDDTGELFTRYINYIHDESQQGEIDINLTTPSDIIYVWEDIQLDGFTDGNKPVQVTAIADGEVYTASYKVFHVMDEENYKKELIMEKRQ